MSEGERNERRPTRATRLRTDGGTDDEPLGDLRRRMERRRESQGETGDGESGEDSDSDATGETAADADELADVLEGRDDEAADASADADDLFTEMSVEDVDTDAVWESVLSDDDDPETVVAPTEEPLTAEHAADVSEGATETEHVVPKKKYCESCRFFTSPPEASCGYEGSSIVEVVNTTEFRVRNCPVVQGVVDVKGSRFDEDDSIPSEASSGN